MSKNKELEVKKEMSMSVLDVLNEVEYDGYENVDPSKHLKRPFFKLAQAKTPQAEKGNPAYIEGLEPGMFFNSATGKVFGDKIDIIILNFFDNYVKYGNKTATGDFRGTITPDEYEKIKPTLKEYTDEKGKRHITDSEGVEYIYTMNLVVIVPSHFEEGVMLYPLTSSGLTPCRNLLSKNRAVMYKGKRAKMFASIWKLGSMARNKDGNYFYQIGDSKTVCADWQGFITEDIAKNVIESVKIAKDYIDNSDKIDYSEATDAESNVRNVSNNDGVEM